jgi:hypothetical protein
MGKIKEILEGHHLASLISIIITSVSLTVSVITYFYNEQRKINDNQYQTDIKKVQLAHTEELQKLREDTDRQQKDLKEHFEDMSFRLRSIERRLGNEKLYLDVISISILRSEIPKLAGKYQSFLSGRLYVSVPSFQKWEQSTISQLELVKLMLGKDIASALGSSVLGPIIGEQNLLMWRLPENFTFHPSNKKIQSPIQTLTLFPCITAFYVDKNYLQRFTKAALQYIQKEAKDEEQSKELKENLSNVISDLRETVVENDDKQSIENSVSKASKIEQASEILGDLYGGDLEAFMMIDVMQNNFQMAAMFLVHHIV